MAETVLRDQRLWIGGASLHDSANAVALSLSAEELDRTTIGDTARARRGGLSDHSIGVDGYSDKGELDAALFASLGLADRVIGVTAPDAAEGAIAYALRAKHGEYQPLGGDVGQLGAFSLAAAADGVIVRGKLDLLRTITAGGVGAGVELEATTGKTLYAAAFVTSLSAGASIDLTVRSAATGAFSSTTERIAFPTIDAAGGYWQAWSGGSSHAFFRASFSVSGSTPSIEAALILAVL